MVDSNGRWQHPKQSSNDDDPDKDFPIRQAFADCSGQTRYFVITYFPLQLDLACTLRKKGKMGKDTSSESSMR
jgi:hypothetical protein